MQRIKLEREMKITHDCGGEFTLPDYVPAIGRMLSAECVPAPEGVYLKETDGRGVTAELGGVASFRILYVPEGSGNDSEDDNDSSSVYGVTVPCDYDAAAMIGNVESPVVYMSTVPENVFCRVTAPRKLQLRCRLGTRITVADDVRIPEIDNSVAGLEKRTGSVVMASSERACARDLLCAFDLSSLPDGSSPVMCSANVVVTECRPTGDTAPNEYRCRGDVIVMCLYERGGEVMTMTEKLPFDEVIVFDNAVGGSRSFDSDASDNALVRACGHIMSCELHTDDSGSRVEVVYELDAEAVTPVGTELVTDAYSCSVPLDVTYDDVEFMSPLCTHTGGVTVSERIPKNEVARVVAVYANASLVDAECVRSHVHINGELRGTALTVSGGEYDAVPFSLPWSYEPPCDCECCDGDTLAVWGDVSVPAITARLDGELSVDADLVISATVVKLNRERVVSSVASSGDEFPARDGFTVYYPAHGETVWDIAKHFHVPASAVATAPNLTSDGTPAGVIVI